MNLDVLYDAIKEHTSLGRGAFHDRMKVFTTRHELRAHLIRLNRGMPERCANYISATFNRMGMPIMVIYHSTFVDLVVFKDDKDIAVWKRHNLSTSLTGAHPFVSYWLLGETTAEIRARLLASSQTIESVDAMCGLDRKLLIFEYGHTYAQGR